MLLPVMRECRNFFVRTSENGDYEINNGRIAVSGRYLAGQYIAITGSLLNDGIKRVESFEGGVISFGINPAEYPAWERPQGTIGLYSAGDKVTHNGERWISLADNNSWEPGAVGTQSLWQQIYDSPEEHSTANEAFSGTIYGLTVPLDFLELCDKIQAFIDSPAGKPSNLVSENVLGVHSYHLATGENGMPAGWQAVFAGKLAPFRKMFAEVKI